MTRTASVVLGVVAGMLAGGGVVYAATSSKAAGAAGGSGPPVRAPGALPAGSPDGLVSSGPTPIGWAQAIALLPNKSGMVYPGLEGDVITVSLPPGAHWRPDPKTQGPSTGIDPLVFSLAAPGPVYVTWTDAANTDHGTVLSFSIGATYAATTALEPGDFVILALTAHDALALAGPLYTATQNPAGVSALELQQASAIFAASQAATSLAGMASVPASVTSLLLFAVGPWAKSFGIELRSAQTYGAGDALPAWWPPAASDTAAFHIAYRYIGPGIAVSNLPFPVMAWRRTA